MIHRAGVLLCLIPVSGCVSSPAPPPDPQPTGPRLTFTLADVTACQPLGVVSSDLGQAGDAPYRLTEKAAQSKIMSGVRALGGDIVLLSHSIVGWEGAHMAGTAYRCAEEGVVTVPPPSRYKADPANAA
jgi:hypothetical protein